MRTPNLSFAKAVKEIGRDAYVDWIIILFLSVIIGVVLVSGGVYLYYAVTKGSIHGSDIPETSAPKSFNKDDLYQITSSFSARENVSSQIKKGSAGISDPSL